MYRYDAVDSLSLPFHVKNINKTTKWVIECGTLEWAIKIRDCRIKCEDTDFEEGLVFICRRSMRFVWNEDERSNKIDLNRDGKRQRKKWENMRRNEEKMRQNGKKNKKNGKKWKKNGKNIEKHRKGRKEIVMKIGYVRERCYILEWEKRVIERKSECVCERETVKERRWSNLLKKLRHLKWCTERWINLRGWTEATNDGSRADREQLNTSRRSRWIPSCIQIESHCITVCA